MERTFDTPDGLEAEVRIPSGMVHVRASDRTTAHVVVEGFREPSDVDVTLTPLAAGGHRLLVEFRGKRSFGFLSVGREHDVRLEVPTGTRLTCDTGSADLDCVGTLGSVAYRTGSGDLRFVSVTGDVTAKSGSGDLQGQGVGGDLSAHTASGDVAVGVIRGSATVRTASGDIRIGKVDGRVQTASVSGDVELASLIGGVANVRSISGDLEIGVASGTGVYLDLASTSGDVSSDLDTGAVPAEAGPELELTASTVSGDVRVRRCAARSAGA
ncbi:MAG: DUF4097 family beta strand repeat-containing protein [Planctomycetaceae bacterium]